MKFATIRSFLTVAVCITGCITLTGCVSRDKTDLENYASDILSRPGGRIEPLPPIKPYERYLYQAGDKNLRDPFRSFVQKKGAEIDIGPIGCNELCREIKTHNRQELEQFELDSLRMVGVLESGDDLWGIIRDPDGTVHRVQVGNYMGANYGKILDIREGQIDLREIITDAPGSYVERSVTLALSEE